MPPSDPGDPEDVVAQEEIEQTNSMQCLGLDANNNLSQRIYEVQELLTNVAKGCPSGIFSELGTTSPPSNILPGCTTPFAFPIC